MTRQVITKLVSHKSFDAIREKLMKIAIDLED
jgi:hypothetical protein